MTIAHKYNVETGYGKNFKGLIECKNFDDAVKTAKNLNTGIRLETWNDDELISTLSFHHNDADFALKMVPGIK